jgi:microsomal epoxide hydrolase
MLGYLKDNFKEVSLDIIVPSIPGYGYSTPLNKKIDIIDTAQLFDALMRHIHSNDDCKYFVHGEDWGSLVATTLAQLYPSRISGIHLSMPISSETLDLSHTLYSLVSPIFPRLLYTQYEIDMNLTSRYNLKSRIRTILRELGYLHLQATKPDTLGHALTDSPVGLLAYILEKYSTWSFSSNAISGKKDGNLNKFNREDLLTIITIYWMSNSITPSIRFYKNYFDLFDSSDLTRRNILDARLSSLVPVSVQYFENEVIISPSSVIKIRYPNLKRYVIEKNGGHFSAFENPILVSDDLYEFIKTTLI